MISYCRWRVDLYLIACCCCRNGAKALLHLMFELEAFTNNVGNAQNRYRICGIVKFMIGISTMFLNLHFDFILLKTYFWSYRIYRCNVFVVYTLMYLTDLFICLTGSIRNGRVVSFTVSWLFYNYFCYSLKVYSASLLLIILFYESTKLLKIFKF